MSMRLLRLNMATQAWPWHPALLGRLGIDADRFQPLDAVVHVGMRAEVIVDLLAERADDRAVRSLLRGLIVAAELQILAEPTWKLQRLVARLPGGDHRAQTVFVGLVFLLLGIGAGQQTVYDRD